MATVRHINHFPGTCRRGSTIVSDFPAGYVVGVNQDFFPVGEGPLTPFPVQVSLKEAMRLLWTVKTWKARLTIDYYRNLAWPPDAPEWMPGSYIKTVSPVTLETSDSNIYTNANWMNLCPDERKIVCMEEREYSSIQINWVLDVEFERKLIYMEDDEVVEEVDTFTDGVSIGIQMGILGTSAFLPRFVREEGFDHYNPPPLDDQMLWLGAEIEIGLPGFSVGSASGYYQGNFSAHTQSAFEYLGKSLTIPLGVSGESPPNAYSVSITNFTWGPETYWPYDPNDDLGPIYDSATGAQLRAF